MTSLEELFQKACTAQTIGGAVLCATNKRDTLKYAKAFGTSSLAPDSHPAPLAVNSVMLIASCTKLMTTIAALQCVEKGLFCLEGDVAEKLPELAEVKILSGFGKDGSPTLKRREKVMTLKHLLTHTSGVGYETMSPRLAKYATYTSRTLGIGSTVPTRFSSPLLFEPGTSWAYGGGIDWVGLLVERLTNMTLEEYMQKNIWTPLGIKDITFWIDRRPDMKARRVEMCIRDTRGSDKAVHLRNSAIFGDVEACMGGQGAYATMPEYLKILTSILRDDAKLLKPDNVAHMFEPQLSPESRAGLAAIRERPEFWQAFVGYFPEHVGLDWGLGGILTSEKDEGSRGKNTLIWSGLPNLFWFIDRDEGVCGIYGGQLLPAGDLPTEKMITLFEKEMYEKARASMSSTMPEVMKAKI